jgi:membrane-anchored glycerophosphoryl diester phosphodiesterase (GDPDase)
MCKVLVRRVVVFLWEAWVDFILTVGVAQSFLSSLAQLLLEQDGISGITLVNRIGDVANEGYKTNDEVDG